MGDLFPHSLWIAIWPQKLKYTTILNMLLYLKGGLTNIPVLTSIKTLDSAITIA